MCKAHFIRVHPVFICPQGKLHAAQRHFISSRVHIMNADILLKTLAARYSEILGDNFVGMYAHGSYAMGCFNPLKSDLDYIIVCNTVPDISVKKAIIDTTVAFERLAPAKGLEMHVMLKENCLHVSYPPKFELHYSPAHTLACLSDPDEYVGRMHGKDPDLGAHLTVMYERGLCICGAELRDVFGAVPKEYYIESVLSDLGWTEGDAMYHVLNHCRTLALASEDKVLSKKEGALWALENADDACKALISRALECYESGEEFAASADSEIFCQNTLAKIKNLLGLSQP